MAPQPQKPRGVIHFRRAPVIGGGVKIGCDIKVRRRRGLVVIRPPTFKKGNMGAEGDAG